MAMRPHLNMHRNEFLGQRTRQPQHQASPRQTPDPVRQHSSSSSESCCRCFVSVQRLSGDGAAELLNARGLTPDAEFTTPEASRQHTGPGLHAQASDSHLAKKLREGGLYQSRVLLNQRHSPAAAAPLPTMSLEAGHSKKAMRSELLEKAQAAKIEALTKAETAAKLVAKAQRLARIAKADAAGRLELQRSASATASSLHRGATEQKHLGRPASVSQSYITHPASARRVHSKTRAGVAALAARQAHQSQALPAGDDTIKQQQQQQQQQRQQQQQQQQHWLSALPKQSNSDCSSAFSALRHAHAGSKRSQEAASLATADPLHTPFKSCRVGSFLPSSPAQMGTCRQQHTLTRQATEAVKGPASGLDASLSSSACQTPAANFLSPCMIEFPEDQQGNSCQLQIADCQQSCRAGLHAHMHRQSNRDSACHWAGTGADASRTNSGSSGRTTLLASVKSEPKGEEDTDYQTGLLLPASGPEHAQQLDRQTGRQQSAQLQTSETAAALCQQHQLHMIDLMLARVSAAEEAIHLGLAQPHQSDLCFQSHYDPWAPLRGCNKLLREKESGTPGEADFFGMESLLFGGSQQAECKLEQLAVIDDNKSNNKDKSSIKAPDDMLEGCTERTHSSSGSSIDCPGRFLVPKDWLLDGSDEVDLDYFSTVSNDDSMLGLALPLMPPSLLQYQE